MKSKTVLTFLFMLGIFILTSIDLKAQVIVNEPPLPPDIPSLPDLEHLEHALHFDEMFISTGRNYGERNSRLMLSKEYTGQTVKKEGTFSVASSITRIKLSVIGEVESGSISVTLVLPDGKELKKLTLDDTADIVWSESINIKDGETKYHGDWKYRISTNQANGEYNLSINTY
jgi:hypothetical protein